MASDFFIMPGLNHSSGYSATMVHGCGAKIRTMVDFATRLRMAMDAAGKDEHALAHALGVSYQAIKKALNGRSKAFSAANNAAAAKLLEVNPNWLATGEGEMKGSGAALVMPAMTIQAGNVVPINKISLRDAVLAIGRELAGRDLKSRHKVALAAAFNDLVQEPGDAEEIAAEIEHQLGGGSEDQPMFSRKTQ